MRDRLAEMETATKGHIKRTAAFIAIALVIALSTLAPASAALLCAPEPAHAVITVGNEETGETTLDGWQPSDMVSTDMQVENLEPNQAANKLEDVIVKIIRILMPFLMVACVAIIIGNAIANIFRPKEQRVAMGDVIKNMLLQFFYILFAFVIVEGIVFVVTGGEAILFSTILS